MIASPTELSRPPTPPRFAAISGLVFAVFDLTSMVLIRLAVPASATESGGWLSEPALRDGVRLSLNLIPFTGIAFLWFMGALRNRIGLQEDRFFATVFFGSGLLFVTMLFAAAALSLGLLNTFSSGDHVAAQSEAFRVGRGTVHALMNTFAMKMAAVFMFVTSTIGLRTSVLSRWVAFAGFAFGLVLLLTLADFAWMTLLFPIWAILVSTQILISDHQTSSRTHSLSSSFRPIESTKPDVVH